MYMHQFAKAFGCAYTSHVSLLHMLMLITYSIDYKYYSFCTIAKSMLEYRWLVSC